MYTNILIPVLFDADHDTQRSFGAAKALAGEGAQFTLIHVVEELPNYVAAAIPDAQFVATRERANAELQEVAKALPGASTHLVTGHAARSILDHANTLGVDCIILASHQPGIEDFFLGSTASRVVRHAKCSVHVIR